MKKYVLSTSAVILTAFGLLTLFLSTSVIFDLFGIRAKEGNYVCLWFGQILSVAFYIFLQLMGLLKTKDGQLHS